MKHATCNITFAILDEDLRRLILPRFWEFESKFDGERSTISRIESEISNFEEEIILIEAWWQCEKNRLAIIEENLRKEQDQLAKEIEAHERTLSLAKFLGAMVFLLLFYSLFCEYRIEKLQRLLEQQQEKNEQKMNSFSSQRDEKSDQQESGEFVLLEECEDKNEGKEDCIGEIGDSSFLAGEADRSSIELEI